MSALDGFYSTWNKARETFGQGTPDDGTQFDGSSRLMQMKAGVEAAAPDDRWQGSGSQAYAAANKDHAAVCEKLAELDKKMAGEVKNAASVVTTGPANLDTAKGWVDSMVNSLAKSNANDREQKLIPIAREGDGPRDAVYPHPMQPYLVDSHLVVAGCRAASLGSPFSLNVATG